VITPFDREDIALLAHSLDDVADFIHAAADAMFLYRVDRPTHRAKELVDIVVQAVAEVERAVSEIHDRVGRKKLLNRCVEINRLENMGDSVFRSAMAELFDDSKDFAGLIKWREIYMHMESVIDRCEDIANILGKENLRAAFDVADQVGRRWFQHQEGCAQLRVAGIHPPQHDRVSRQERVWPWLSLGRSPGGSG
jgi:hypothetical protein